MKKAIILGALLLPTLLLVGCSGDKEVKKETVKSSAEKVVKNQKKRKSLRKPREISSARLPNLILMELCCVVTHIQ